MDEQENPYRAPQEAGTRSAAFGCLVLLSLPFAVLAALATTCAVEERNAVPSVINIFDAAVVVATTSGAVAALLLAIACWIKGRRR